METKIIYTRKMALFLRDRGHKILKTIPDQTVPHFWNWVFEDTAALQSDITEYMNRRKNHEEGTYSN